MSSYINLGAEQSFLGSLLLSQSVAEEFVQAVSEDDFTVDTNRVIFHRISAMADKGERIDPVTLMDRLVADGESRDILQPYLLQLMDITPTAANVQEYAAIVRENGRKRLLQKLAEDIDSALTSGCQSDKIVAATERALTRVDKLETSNELVDWVETSAAFWSYRKMVDDGQGYVKTGYGGIDKLLGGGLMNTSMYILAARPGMGKTTVALNIAEKVMATGGAVLYVTLEMSKEQIHAKRLSMRTGISVSDLLMGDCRAEYYTSLGAADAEMASLRFYHNRMATCNVNHIRHMAKRIKGLTLLIVDHIGLIAVDEKQNRVQAMRHVSNSFKALARELNIPALVLCQLNRANEARQDKRAHLADLRDTGAIEEDADGVLFLYRDSYYSDDHDDVDVVPMSIYAEKMRFGRCTSTRVAFELSTGNIYDVAK